LPRIVAPWALGCGRRLGTRAAARIRRSVITPGRAGCRALLVAADEIAWRFVAEALAQLLLVACLALGAQALRLSQRGALLHTR
jgi:hypothetical protein